MAGGGNDGAQYGSLAALVFIFNIVVGVGALSLPHLFLDSGILLASICLALLAFFAYVSATWIIESQALANAALLTDQPEAENRFEIRKRLELLAMAELFLGKRGVILVVIAVIVYLFGDLAIYAVAVPKTLLIATSGSIQIGSLVLADTNLYRAFVLVFFLVVAPFCFFDFSNTKYLQYVTLTLRQVSFVVMIIVSIMFAVSSERNKYSPSSDPIPIFRLSGIGSIFGVAIYSFMCHHSIPSLIFPVKNKNKLMTIFAIDYVFIFAMNLVLCISALFAFSGFSNPTCKSNSDLPCRIQDLYTLNFSSYHIQAISHFLVLYPVFSLTTNFPLLAITLRNNMLFLFKYCLKSSQEQQAVPASSWLVRVISSKFGVTLITIVPAILIAASTQDLGLLVSLTGSIAGLGIQYLIPTALVYFGRQQMRETPDKQGLLEVPATCLDLSANPLKSPFQHRAWIWAMIVWSMISFSLAMSYQIKSAT